MGQGVNNAPQQAARGRLRPNPSRPMGRGTASPRPESPGADYTSTLRDNISSYLTDYGYSRGGSRGGPRGGPYTQPRRPGRGHLRGSRGFGGRFIETPDYIRDAESRYGALAGSPFWGNEDPDFDRDRIYLGGSGAQPGYSFHARGPSRVRTPTRQEWAAQNALGERGFGTRQQFTSDPDLVMGSMNEGDFVTPEMTGTRLVQNDLFDVPVAGWEEFTIPETTSPHMYDFNRDGGVGLDDLAAAIQAQSIFGDRVDAMNERGAAYIAPGPDEFSGAGFLDATRGRMPYSGTRRYDMYSRPGPLRGGPRGGTVGQRSREGRLPGGASGIPRGRDPRFGANRLSPRGGITDAYGRNLI